MTKIILITIAAVAVAFVALAIKLLLTKNGRFAGTCAGNSEFARKEGIVCSVCGSVPGEECKK